MNNEMRMKNEFRPHNKDRELRTGETVEQFKRRKGANYTEMATRHRTIESLVEELVARHRGDIPEKLARALGDEILKRLAIIHTKVQELLNKARKAGNYSQKVAYKRILTIFDEVE